MNSDKSKVAVFIVVGILMAGVVGALVWRSGSPAIPSVSDTATTSQLSSTSDPANASASPTVLPTTPEASDPVVEAAPPAPADDEISMPAADDPFLAPHAVVVAPERVSPTTVYRPDNVGDALDDATSATGLPNTMASPATTGSGTQLPTPESLAGSPSPEGEATPPDSSATSATSPATTEPTELTELTESTEPMPSTDVELSEPDEATEDVTEEVLDSLTPVPTVDGSELSEPSEPVELSPTPALSEPAPVPTSAPAVAPAPVEQDLQGTTPDSGSGSAWSWSTVRNWFPW